MPDAIMWINDRLTAGCMPARRHTSIKSRELSADLLRPDAPQFYEELPRRNARWTVGLTRLRWARRPAAPVRKCASMERWVDRRRDPCPCLSGRTFGDRHGPSRAHGVGRTSMQSAHPATREPCQSRLETFVAPAPAGPRQLGTTVAAEPPAELASARGWPDGLTPSTPTSWGAPRTRAANSGRMSARLRRMPCPPCTIGTLAGRSVATGQPAARCAPRRTAAVRRRA